MRAGFVILLFLMAVVMGISLSSAGDETASLRRIYTGPPTQWPAPFIDSGSQWKELGVLPNGPLAGNPDSLAPLVTLGKILFFDPRLSGSGKISCGTCHQPSLSWTDGLARSLGHEGQVNKRNAPSIQNSWFYQRLFWDGRSSGLEDQAFAPINSESEMHADMRELPANLRRIKGYPPLFQAAYGDAGINPDRVAGALAAFQRTIISNRSRLDDFFSGNKNAISNAELRGLHLFRTRARCMNCHQGPLLTDNQFHNNGFSGSDKGLYQVTHRDEDMGKMKTPSLRDVTMTGPWMHDGSEKHLDTIIAKYNRAAMPAGADAMIKPLHLSARDKKDLLAFLHAASAPPRTFEFPELPK